MNHSMKKYTRAFLKSIGTILFFIVCTGALVAVAAWQEPGIGAPNLPGVNPTINDYQPNHALMDEQQKNYTILPGTIFSVGSPQSIYSGGAIGGGGGGGAAAFSPFLALVSGNFFQVTNNPAGYTFPEATYVEGMKKLTGNITARSRPDTTANNVAVIVPGFVKADVSALTGNACAGANNPCNVLFLEGGNQTGLPANDPANDMVNIFLTNNKNEFSALPGDPNYPDYVTASGITTNRFGLEKASGFASLRMGQVYVDKAFVGGLVNTPLTTAVPAGTTNNYVGNFVSGPDAVNIAKPSVLQGGLSSGAGTTATTKFSNLGYGDYCYLQNPTVGGSCPDGFFLSKYDGKKEAICRSFNPSPNPTAIDVIPDFRHSPALLGDLSNHITNAVPECKSTLPVYVCEDGLDNDGDGLTDYQNGNGDPGCISNEDMSEKNVVIPPPAPTMALVSAKLRGPFPSGNGCYQFANPYPGYDNNYANDFITFVDIGPSVVTGNPPTAADIQYGNDWYHNVANNQYFAAQPKVPQAGDLIISNGHYDYTYIGANGGNYVRKGPVVPGWYFVQLSNGPLYKIKLNWGNTIAKVKAC